MTSNALKKNYRLKFLLDEIFFYNEKKTKKTIIETLAENELSVSEDYLEDYFIKTVSVSIDVVFLIIDYFILYMTIFLLNDIFYESQNSFYYLLYKVCRLTNYLKMIMLYFEYSKYPILKKTCFVLNLIFIERCLNFPGMDQFDYTFLIFIKLINYIYALLTLESSMFFYLISITIAWSWLYYDAPPFHFLMQAFISSVLTYKTVIGFTKMDKCNFLVYLGCFLVNLIAFKFLEIDQYIRANYLKSFPFPLYGIKAYFGCDYGRGYFLEMNIISYLKEFLVQLRELLEFY